MCLVSATFPRPSFRGVTTSFALRPALGICIALGPRRTCASCRMPDTRHSRQGIRTNSCSRPIGTAAAEELAQDFDACAPTGRPRPGGFRVPVLRLAPGGYVVAGL